MQKLIHAIFLVTGTSIGAGLIALPMTVVNLGTVSFGIMIAIMVWLAYQSSCMTAQLNVAHKTPASIVELSRQYGGKVLFAVTLSSFYLLFFGLLTVYFSCMADTMTTCSPIGKTPSIILCGCGLFLFLNLKTRLFSDLNSVFVVILLAVIAVAVISIRYIPETVAENVPFRAYEWIKAVPILFTSFGIQGSCAYFCFYLRNDLKRLKLSFCIGLLIPAVIYLVWTMCCLKTAAVCDGTFYQRLQAHKVPVGELIRFLCESSSLPTMGVFLKLLTLFAVLTSTIGVAAGLLQPLQAFLPKTVAKGVLCFVPVLINLTVAEAFLKVLSFGGMMLAILSILVPYKLLKPMGMQKNPLHRLCFIGGLVVVICELWSVLC
ncbi:MAG: hypothetical protein IJ793_00880 [Opitutales bacterium]|nr:hypothetical protein [Opitutales bacterium]